MSESKSYHHHISHKTSTAGHRPLQNIGLPDRLVGSNPYPAAPCYLHQVACPPCRCVSQLLPIPNPINTICHLLFQPNYNTTVPKFPEPYTHAGLSTQIRLPKVNKFHKNTKVHGLAHMGIRFPYPSANVRHPVYGAQTCDAYRLLLV